MWDVLSGDFDPNLSPQDCLSSTLQITKAGSIVIFHDSVKAEKNMRFALPKFLEYFTKQGYTFKSL
jgi:peptidoglycan/xylan/chitin deacetylase (PgdA/CDA1 family)